MPKEGLSLPDDGIIWGGKKQNSIVLKSIALTT